MKTVILTSTRQTALKRKSCPNFDRLTKRHFKGDLAILCDDEITKYELSDTDIILRDTEGGEYTFTKEAINAGDFDGCELLASDTEGTDHQLAFYSLRPKHLF